MKSASNQWADIICHVFHYSVFVISFSEPLYNVMEGETAQVGILPLYGQLANNMEFTTTVQTVGGTARGMYMHTLRIHNLEVFLILMEY